MPVANRGPRSKPFHIEGTSGRGLCLDWHLANSSHIYHTFSILNLTSLCLALLNMSSVKTFMLDNLPSLQGRIEVGP